MAELPEPIRPAVIILERGKVYTFRPSQPVFCLQCLSEVTQEMDSKLMVYVGILDGVQHLFLYDDPPKCQTCGFVFRYHTDGSGAPIDVTDEFRNLLDKK